MSKPSERWAIVGGGLLGLTLAHRLAQAGKQVTLFEGADSLGGLAGAWSLGDVVWDRHYHVTLLSDTTLRSLLEELGLEHEMRWVETRTGFYTGGQLYSMSNTLEFLRFPPLGLVDKLRLGATIFYASRVKDWQRLEEMLVADWLRRWSGRHTFEKIWLPLLRAKLGENYRQTSAAFIWATIARMYAARRTGLKKEMFGYVPGGYARVLERLSEALSKEGVGIKLGHAVTRVERAGASVRVEFENGVRETFDQVVLTVPAPVAARVCEGLAGEEKERLSNVRYQGIICASLLLKKPLADFYVTNITDASVPFTAVIEMSALVDREHFGGNALVYLPKYVDPDDAAFALSDAEIREQFLAALVRMYPHFERADVVSFRVSRVRHVFPLPTLSYSKRLPAVTPDGGGVHILNSAHILNGTLNVNETVQLAERSVAQLLAQTNGSKREARA
ncbi:MAG: NAD(P)/FAD-dependent oxidoreductase [Pyrinomonadaceae bacterium]